MARQKKWTREEAARVFEILIEKGSTLTANRFFRKALNRDQNLLANQLVRRANGNIAYRSVDFEITDEMSDDSFWEKIEKTPYNDFIEENAAVALIKMAEKLDLLQ